MSKDDAAPWNPDDENVERNAMKKLLELAEKQLKSLDRVHPPHPPGVYGVAMPPSFDSFEVRAINNGFIIRLYEWIPEFGSARPVEFFAKDWEEAAPLLSRGLGSIRILFDQMRKPRSA